MWPAPRPKFKPAVWRFAAAKAALDQAGEFVPVEQAERRNLIMVNPVEGNIYATSRNIVAAYQMVKAGEKARSHRHTAAALRNPCRQNLTRNLPIRSHYCDNNRWPRRPPTPAS